MVFQFIDLAGDVIDIHTLDKLGQFPEIGVTASDDSAIEGAPDNGEFLFTRTGDTTNSLDVSYTVSEIGERV